MKLVVTFFLFTFLLLTGAHNPAQAGVSTVRHYHPHTRFLTKASHSQSAITKPGLIITSEKVQQQEDDLLIAVEDEDEEIIGKNNAAGRVFLAFYYAFILKDCCSFVADPLPSYKHLFYLGSSKYIVQRVLRL